MFDIFSVCAILIIYFFSGIFYILPYICPEMVFVVEFIESCLMFDDIVKQSLLSLPEGISTYFQHSIQYLDNSLIDDSQTYIKCMMPHSLMPYSLFCCLNDSFFDCTNNSAVYHSFLTKLPVLPTLLDICNFIPAEYHTMKDTVKNKYSLVVYPGGVKEMLLTDDSKDNIYIKNRKGIFKLAYQTGTPLIPVFTFGMDKMYEKSSVGIQIPSLFGNSTDAVHWYFGYFNTPIPMRVKLTTVVGRPILVSKKSNPTREDIQQLRDKYISGINDIHAHWLSQGNKSVLNIV